MEQNNKSNDFINKPKFDFGVTSDTLINALLLKESGTTRPLVELCNRYNIYGAQAIKFITELIVVANVIVGQLEETEE
jgi:hypothetical protein